MCHRTRQIVVYAIRDRSEETRRKLWEQISILSWLSKFQ